MRFIIFQYFLIILDVPVDIKEINDIPLGGNSLPIIISTDYAPDIGIEVVIRLDQNYPGLALSSPTVPLLQGANTNSFYVILFLSILTNYLDLLFKYLD